MRFFIVFVIMVVSILIISIIISNVFDCEYTLADIIILPFLLFVFVFIFCGIYLTSGILAVADETNLEILEVDKKSNIEANENIENNIKSEKEELYIDSKSIEIDENIVDDKTDEEKLQIILENLEETYNYLRKEIYQSDEISSELKIEIESYNKKVEECLSSDDYRIFQDLAIIELDIIQK